MVFVFFSLYFNAYKYPEPPGSSLSISAPAFSFPTSAYCLQPVNLSCSLVNTLKIPLFSLLSEDWKKASLKQKLILPLMSSTINAIYPWTAFYFFLNLFFIEG